MKGIMNDKQIVSVTLDKDMFLNERDVLLKELELYSSVEDVAFSDWLVGFQDYYPYTYTKSAEDEDMRYYFIPVSPNFTDFMGLTILEGRGFEERDVSIQEERLVINELAAKQFKVKPGDRLANACLVIGIIQNFNFMNLRKEIEPMALTNKIIPSGVLMPTIYVRTAGNAHQAVEQIKAGVAKIDPLYPVDVKFYNQQFEQTYQKEKKTSSQITLFSLLAIIISLIGVFGLVTFETQFRRKEISIRKAMGADVFEILLMFNKKFVRIVIISFVLATPIVWYSIDSWLQSFAYQTPIYWWVFVLSLLIVTLMTFLTVTLQSWRIITANPIRFLKSE